MRTQPEPPGASFVGFRVEGLGFREACRVCGLRQPVPVSNLVIPDLLPPLTWDEGLGRSEFWSATAQ